MPKLCEFETCRNRATYGINRNTLRCFEHKENNMKLSCSLCHCGKAHPTYNLEGLKYEYCASCKTNEMTDVKNNKCYCGKINPIYNIEGLKPEYCASCKTNEMTNVKNKKCYCGKAIPIYNLEGLKPEYCASCKTIEMIDVKNNKCYCGKKRPIYNLEGLKPEYCASCKTNEMTDVKNHRCKADNCQTTGNKNYKGYCANCFQHLFPTDPLTFQIRSKTKEIAVRDFINAKFEGFQHDKPIWYNETVCDCTTKRRIDHRKLINGTLLCIETDENQHKSYSKTDEEARYNDIFMAFGGKFIFIRFNPDKYKDKNGKSCNPMLVNRLPVLEDEINKQIKRIETGKNTELLEVIELYYDKSI